MTENTGLPLHPHLTHPRTGDRLRAIYRTRGGRLVWPVLGGDGTDDPPAGDPPADPAKDPAGDPPKDEPLGEGGKRALDAEKAARKAAEKELAQFRKADEDRKLAGKTELEQAQARQAAAEKKAEAATQRAVKAEVKAAATGWADPSDAPRYLDDLSTYVDDDGNVDAAGIEAALKKVLADKPHLAKPGTDPSAGKKDPPKRPKPDPSQGARPGTKSTAADRASARLQRLGIKTESK